MMLAFDEQRTDEWILRYSYFEQAEPGLFDAPGTYVHTEAEFGHNQVSDWSHGIGDVITAILDAGLELTMFVEHDSAPNEVLPGRMYLDDGEWRLIDHPERLPLSYTLQAVKR
jgi:hypothetical protein